MCSSVLPDVWCQWPFPLLLPAVTDLYRCFYIDTITADLEESYYRNDTCFFGYVSQLLEFKCDANFIITSCKIIILKVALSRFIKEYF